MLMHLGLALLCLEEMDCVDNDQLWVMTICESV